MINKKLYDSLVNSVSKKHKTILTESTDKITVTQDIFNSLSSKLMLNVVVFVFLYKKSDGSAINLTFGTTKPDFLEKLNAPEKPTQLKNCILYYDIKLRSWRYISVKHGIGQCICIAYESQSARDAFNYMKNNEPEILDAYNKIINKQGVLKKEDPSKYKFCSFKPYDKVSNEDIHRFWNERMDISCLTPVSKIREEWKHGYYKALKNVAMLDYAIKSKCEIYFDKEGNLSIFVDRTEQKHIEYYALNLFDYFTTDIASYMYLNTDEWERLYYKKGD